MEEKNVTAAWTRQLDVMDTEIQQLAHVDDVFWQMQALVAANPSIPRSRVIMEWIGVTYVNTIVAGLRRLVDRTRGTVSLSRLLGNMSRQCTLLTRERFVALHDAASQELASEWFTEIAGGDHGHIPRSRILGLETRLRSAFEGVCDFSNARVTHRREEPGALVTFEEVRRALVEAFLVYSWASRALRSRAPDSSVPIIQSDWLAAFTVPWIEEGCELPSYEHLDEVVEAVEREHPVEPAHQADAHEVEST